MISGICLIVEGLTLASFQSLIGILDDFREETLDKLMSKLILFQSLIGILDDFRDSPTDA